MAIIIIVIVYVEQKANPLSTNVINSVALNGLKIGVTIVTQFPLETVTFEVTSHIYVEFKRM